MTNDAPFLKAGGSRLLLCLHCLCIDYIPAKPMDLVSHYGTVFNIIPVHLSPTYTEYTDQAQHYDHQAQYSSVQQTHVLNKLYSGNLLLEYLFRILRLPFFWVTFDVKIRYRPVQTKNTQGIALLKTINNTLSNLVCLACLLLLNQF